MPRVLSPRTSCTDASVGLDNETVVRREHHRFGLVDAG